MTRHAPRSLVDRERAYQHWRRSGSLRQTAAALGIPEGTVIAWSRVDGWVARRDVDDKRDIGIVRDHALHRLYQELDVVTETVVSLVRSADRDAVRLDAAKLVYRVTGMTGDDERGERRPRHTARILPATVDPASLPIGSTPADIERLRRRLASYDGDDDRGDQVDQDDGVGRGEDLPPSLVDDPDDVDDGG